MIRPLRRAVLLAAVALHCASASAAALDADAGSDWEAYLPPDAAPGGAAKSPFVATTPEGGFSAPDRVIFVEKMREGVLDQLCRNIKLEYDYSLPDDFGGTGAGFRRWLAPLPDGRLTLVDEERLNVGYGRGLSKAVGGSAGASVGLWLGARLEGSSMVIRPLEGKATCKELGRLVDLRDIKTVLPFKGERIAAMKVGELWRLPFLLNVGHAESAAAALSGRFSLSLSFSGTEGGAATLTVYRLSESELRVRFRVDRVEVRAKGGNLVETIPAAEFAALGTSILAKFVSQEIARQINRYTVASLGFSDARTRGKRVLLEYVVDPRDPAQAAAVASALHGDFQSLVKMGWRLGAQGVTDASTEAAYLRMKSEHDAQLGPAEYAAIDAYAQRAKSITLNLPLLTAQNWATMKGDSTMTNYTGDGGEFHFVRADKSRASEYLNIPFVGPLFKNSVQRDVQVVTQARAGEAYGDPIVVYLQQHGFLRATATSVREKAAQFSEIMALAGARGGGRDPRLALPLARQFPGPPAPGPRDRKGALAFTLVFNQEAVKQLAAATAEDIIKSYVATVKSSPALRWLVENGRIRADGNLTYDARAARRLFPDQRGRRSGELSELETMAKEASGLVCDLLDVRGAPDNQARSAALARAFSGAGKSGLSHARAVRVFVQLVDPLNLTGDFIAMVDGPSRHAEYMLHLVLKKNRPENKLLLGAGAAKSRFAQPSILVD